MSTSSTGISSMTSFLLTQAERRARHREALERKAKSRRPKRLVGVALTEYVHATLERKGSMTTASLSEMCGVSKTTVRQHLHILRDCGMAVCQPPVAYQAHAIWSVTRKPFHRDTVAAVTGSTS